MTGAQMSLDAEILEGFKEETAQLVLELTDIVEQLEEYDSPEMPKQLLSDYAQKIDRIMGTANTLLVDSPEHKGLNRIAKLSGLCKTLGYTAAELDNRKLVPIFAAFWADTTEVTDNLVKAIADDEKSAKIAAEFSSVLQSRLEWLANKIDAVEGKGVPMQVVDNNAVDDLLAEFGI